MAIFRTEEEKAQIILKGFSVRESKELEKIKNKNKKKHSP